MRIVALEEHFATPDVLEAQGRFAPQDRDLAYKETAEGETNRLLLEIGDERIAAMDAAGVDVQVLSLTTPGVQNLAPDDAIRLARLSNDHMARAIADNPTRFRGFATLPTASPRHAVVELERAISELDLDGAMVFGRTGDLNMDHPSFWPIYELGAARRIPLHLHPQSPQKSVQAAYYSGFSEETSAEFATIGVGWHFEAGIQFVRMIIAGVFDRFPQLQVITGHWGELMFFFLERLQHLADVARLPRPLDDYVKNNLFIAPSGIMSERYMRWAIEVAGVDRILFSTDYPFTSASKSGAREFLEALAISDRDRELIASGNWLRLQSAIVR